jgi:hypothetical protein
VSSGPTPPVEGASWAGVNPRAGDSERS